MKNIFLIAADLLQIASDEMSNAGCNDYYLEDTPENREIVLAAQKEKDPENTNICIKDKDILTSDDLLAEYCAKMLRKKAE